MPYIDYDFIGFTYNGKHSIKDLKIYRTSSGGRYETNLKPNTTEKTASVDGQIGQYYFGTKVDSLNLTIPFAFEDLSESELLELKRVFSGDGLHELVFDETPYKAYTAKVTSTAVVKHLCFENNEVRHYRGEGSIQFTCYYPYAHSRKDIGVEMDGPMPVEVGTYQKSEEGDEFIIISNHKEIPCGIFVKPGDSIQMNSNFIGSTETLGFNTNFLFINKNGEKLNELPIEGEDIYYLASLTYDLDTLVNKEPGENGKITVEPGFTIINSESMFSYVYTSKGCFESEYYENDGKILNCYTSIDFPTKQQWGFACGLPLHQVQMDATTGITNHGERPVHFILTCTLSDGKTFPENTPIDFGDGSILPGARITGPSKYIWNSELGLLISEDNENNKTILPYSGEGCLTIPAGETWKAGEIINTFITANLQYEYL